MTFAIAELNIRFCRLRNVNDSFYSKLSGTDSESGDETELFTRNKHKAKEVKFIEKVVEDGDTLQSLSIKYRCPVSSINSFMRDRVVIANAF